MKSHEHIRSSRTDEIRLLARDPRPASAGIFLHAGLRKKRNAELIGIPF